MFWRLPNTRKTTALVPTRLQLKLQTQKLRLLSNHLLDPIQRTVLPACPETDSCDGRFTVLCIHKAGAMTGSQATPGLSSWNGDGVCRVHANMGVVQKVAWLAIKSVPSAWPSVVFRTPGFLQ